MLTLLKEAMLKHAATSKGFLIDGYPRELDQGKRFEADVAAVECVLYFEVNSVFQCFSKPDLIGSACVSVCVTSLFTFTRDKQEA